MDIIYDENTGLLVPGEHKLTLEEFEKEFVYNIKRREIYHGLLKLIDIFRAIGCTHLYADGSYVTKKPLPGDIDICWHMHEDKDQRTLQLNKLQANCPQIFNMEREFIKKEFCADVFPANVHEGATGLMFKDFFQKDKNTDAQKGIIIIDLL